MRIFIMKRALSSLVLVLALASTAPADSITFRIIPASSETVWVQCTLTSGDLTTKGIAPVSVASLRDPVMAPLASQNACEKALEHAIEMRSRLRVLLKAKTPE